MLVRPVVKGVFFPWKTKEKKAHFARAPHDCTWYGAYRAAEQTATRRESEEQNNADRPRKADTACTIRSGEGRGVPAT